MADERIEIEVGGAPLSDSNPLPTKAASNTSGPVTIADGADVAEGAKGDAAWSGSGSGSVVAILKAVYAKAAATLGFSTGAGASDATTLRVITASDGPLNTNLGATTDAAIVGDASGSISGKIRYLGKVFADIWDSTNHAVGIKHSPPVGTPTHTADATVDNTAGGVTILGSNASRKAAIIQVVSGGNVRVSIGGTPTTTNGIQLGVGGSPLIIEGTGAYGCPTGAIKAIRESAASGVVAVVEIA